MKSGRLVTVGRESMQAGKSQKDCRPGVRQGDPTEGLMVLMEVIEQLAGSIPEDLLELMKQSLSTDPQERTLDLEEVASW